MEALLARQSELISSIENLYNNYKKDGASRKTSDYIQKRLVALDNLWGEFQQNDTNLKVSEDKSSEYFTNNIFDRIRQYYEGARAAIANFRPQPTFSNSFEVPEFKDSDDDDTTKELDEMLVRQRSNIKAFRRIISRSRIEDIEERWEIEDVFKTLQHRWNAIEELHLRIDSKQQFPNAGYDNDFMDAEDTFITIKRQLNKKLSSTVHLKRSIPQVDIPTFTGKFTQWPTFNDLYTETIHNNKYLNNAQKMQHLKSKLKGEPERLIQHLYISADNYETAWEILNHRYNNTQVLFTKQAEVLLNQPIINKQTSFELKRLYDTTTECIHAIHNLGVDTNSWDPLLVHILSKKLDTDTYSDYKEARKEPRELPSLDEFMSFIETKFTALEPIHEQEKKQPVPIKQSSYQYQTSKSSYEKRPNSQGRFTRKNYHYQAAPAYARKHCPLCEANHDLYKCNQFLSIPTDQIMDTITKNKICPNCLYKHYEKSCVSLKRCKNCNEKHNTLIHQAASLSNTNRAFTSQGASSNSSRNNTSEHDELAKSSRQHHANYVATDDEEILLTTISIKIKSYNNNYIVLRALLDQGSQVSLISERAAQMLGLPRKNYHASVSGIGPSSKQSKGMVTLECQSIYEDYHFMTQALVISQVINNLPTASFAKQSWPHIQRIDLADPDYNVSKPIDLLLDASVYSEIIMSGLIKGPTMAPIAQQTKLGWILSGHVTKSFSCNVVTNHLEDLTKYWELEDIQESNSTVLTKEEQYCEELYQTTTRRLENGRYEVAIPMKPDFEQHLGSSKPRAVAQFLQIEKKMAKNHTLSDAYQKFMNEYEQLHHMRKVDSVKEPACYLPHHGVVKLDSTTTALRVVFNASSKTSSGRSLNDLMECGPNLQQDLQSLVLRWRQYRYVLTADIEKMFRQITVRDKDQSLQTILWRCSPNELIKEHQLTTVTYGTKAAPFLAMRTLKQIARDNPDQQLAAAALETSFFMDDLLCGNDSLDQAKALQHQLIEVLKGAGMNLRKWSSNEPELTRHLSHDLLSTAFEFKDTDTRKTLGLKWNPSSDTFTYQNKLECKDGSKVTKRTFLSDISKVYDPLGWLSPLTIRGKLLFQKTWLTEISWDDELPNHIHVEWIQLKNDLMSIENFAIPRYLGQSGQSLQLHGFCDASEKAYACAIYIVTTNSKGECTSKLVTAKTRVAPTKKQVSLPRLELLGALLLSQLMKKVIVSLSATDIRIHAWTDSMIVLGWLHGDVTKWKQFVANRVYQITDIIPASSWRHVRSEENAADCATRGMSSTNLSAHSLWWNGPTWLTTFDSEHSIEISYQEPIIEAKSKYGVNTALQQNHTESFIIKLLNKYSSLTKVAKTIAWVSRYIARLRNTQNASFGSTLTASELENAMNIIIITIQGIEYENDLSFLRSKGHVSYKSKVSNLNPFIDEKGILRVGGRLRHADLSFSAKHPIILPSESRLTELIINQAHQITLHGGPKLTLSCIRDKFWIVSGVRTVKKHLRRCVRCLRFKQENRQCIMADLPKSRVTPSRPFTNTGVDFTGHVDVKSNKGRGVRTSKGYIAVFVCLSTKAVHLELVSDMSTASFLAAFRRMCSRRGTPKNVYSDNGTNFVGASRELKKEYQEIIQTINTEFINDINEMGITWHFNAPAWPSAGGLWEAAVKSLKYHLKRVLGEQKLTYEKFTTLLYQIEASMNSRPLCSLTESPDDTYLTPGHFLVGDSIISRPQTDPGLVSLSTRWHLVQTMNKQFWKRWSNEYLQQLQIRSKWRKQDENLNVDDVVIIKEDNMPPGQWAMGRVCETHPGADGNVRVVSLKTKNNVIKRPISKLVVLPVSDCKPEEKDSTQDNAQLSQKQDHQDQPRIRQLRPRNRNLRSFFITALLLITSFIPASYQTSYNITSITSKNSLYFDMQIIKDEWKMIVYYNMTTYWQTITNIELYINSLRKSCEDDNIRSVIVSQFEHELNEIKHYNQLLIRTHRYRTKRGLINAVGNIANALFGVLDDKFAEQYKQDIETLHENESHLLKLLKNQTSIIEADNNILHRNEQLMNQQFENINKQFNSIAHQIYKSERMNQHALNAVYQLTNTMAIDVIISNLRRVQETLINTVADIHQGHLDTHLLSPEQLQDQLNIISGQLSDDISIPVKPENIRDLYQLLHVRATVKSNYLIIEIRIPLTTNAKYELDYLIPLPQKTDTGNVYVTPAMEYIAFDMRKDTFIPISAIDLFSCLKHQGGSLLCNLNAPIYQLQVEQSICDVKIITNNNNQTFCSTNAVDCTDRWIKLHSSDSWLYSCCDECQIRIMCPAGLTSRRLQGSGIITLGEDCHVKGDTFTLHAHHDYESHLHVNSPLQTINLPQISPLNEFINTTLPPRFLKPTENHEMEFTAIKKQIEEIQKATISEVSSNDIHHYVMIYIIITIMCATVISVSIYFMRKRWCNNNTNKQQQQLEHPVVAYSVSPTAAFPLYARPSTSRSMEDMNSEVRKPARVLKSSSASNVAQATPPTARRALKFAVPQFTE